jgi:hypothetical protein
LAELDTAAPADTTNPLITSLEDANVARNAVLYGKAAFQSNLVPMNMDEEVAKVIRRNYADKLAAAEGKINDIEKNIEAEKVAGVKAATERAELQSKIKKLERKGDQYENEMLFWASIHNMVSLGPKGLKTLFDVMKSQGMSLNEVIHSIMESEVVDVDNSGDGESESEIPATPQTSD